MEPKVEDVARWGVPRIEPRVRRARVHGFLTSMPMLELVFKRLPVLREKPSIEASNFERARQVARRT